MKRIVLFIMLAVLAVLLLGAPLSASAAPVIYYVNDDAVGVNTGTSWQDAFTDVQSALNAAVSGDEIWVAEGTYKPSLADRTASFNLKSGVAIYGGFSGDETARGERSVDAKLTVLSGDIGTEGVDTDNSYHVVSAVDVTSAVLDGFSVTRGFSAVTGTEPGIKAGAGMYTNNSSVTVNDCIFTRNRAPADATHGGGMCNVSSCVTVTGCTFSDNEAGGTVLINSTNYTYDGSGGGMYNAGGYGADAYGRPIPSVIRDCTFTDNVAWYHGEGGAMLNQGCSPTVDRCTFLRNHGYNGGAMLNSILDYEMAVPTVSNCVFSGNWTPDSGRGGAICNLDTHTYLIHDTFYKNGWRPDSAPPRAITGIGGAVCDYREGSLVVDCLFVENANWGYDDGAYAAEGILRIPVTLVSCLFYKNIWQNGVINGEGGPSDIRYWNGKAPELTDILYEVDPLLVDPANGDFHLLPDSPCIDAGVTERFAEWNWWPFPATDFEGDNRAVDGDADGVRQGDIGADEYVPNLADLRTFLEGLAPAGEIDSALEADLLGHVADSQTALDQGDELAAITALRTLIADAQTALGDTETEKTIASKATAVLFAEDTHAPIVTAPADVTVEATDWDGATIGFAASAADNIDGTVPASSIHYYIYYHTGAQEEVWSDQTFPVGATTVTAAATDSCGNVGAATFTITVTPPVTSCDAPSGWQKGDVTVTFTRKDPSDVAYTYYILDHGAQTEGSSVTVSGEGIHSLTFWSVDYLGHTETAHSVEVKIDTSGPTTSVLNYEGQWVNAPVTLQFSAIDPQSGVASIQYSTNNRNWVTGTSYTVSAGGQSTVYFRSIDKVGNVEQKSIVVRIDRAAPTITIITPKAKTTYRRGSTIPVTALWTAVDNASGVASTTGPSSGSVIDTSVAGNFAFTVTATDNAGNTASKTVTYSVK